MDADFEGQQVTLSRRTFINIHIDRISAALLVIERIVLDVAEHMLRLLASYDRCHHLSGKYRIFAHVFKGAAVARLAGKVDAATERHVVALRAQLAPDQSSIFESALQIP